MKKGDTVIIEKDWAGFSAGDRFTVVDLIPCNPVSNGNGGTITPMNLRCVIEGNNPDDSFFHRTIPAEYAIPIPRVGASDTVYANQGDRDATVLATIGSEVLYEYEMPAGKTFLRIVDLLRPSCYRAVSRTALPKKWKKEIES